MTEVRRNEGNSSDADSADSDARVEHHLCADQDVDDRTAMTAGKQHQAVNLLTVNRFYTGVGSTEPPPDVAALVILVAQHLAGQGMVVRTGHDKGTDAAFATAAAAESRRIYVPHSGAGGYQDGLVVCDPETIARATRLAASVHPHWKSYNNFQRRAHTRRVFQLLGEDLDSPSAYVICFVPEDGDGKIQGSARTILALAQVQRIECYNLAELQTRTRFRQRLAEIAFQGEI
ncbi:hypothetical protein [Gloeobacter morelensis]|uniref:Uncharacterized protein n=1 Tax=Gloeobacter morelensis MG652769 TaxID=2781736 RepID=A0ABY3PLM2_9CYAN|nr:hypothetical protein [Gloeobacter morelensis]UFP94580.1 hypothetical protein ISF26_23070 [Gloeobacter morelensis MG652769]